MSNSSEVEAQAPAPPVEQLPGPEVEAPAVAETPEVASEELEKKQKAPKEKKQKKQAPKEKKPKSPVHPPYFQMIKEAITALNEKGGSSPYAIAKYMEEKQKAVLPANFRKILGLQLKNSVAKGNLIKIKASYKLSEAGKRGKSTATATGGAITRKAARANAAKPKEEKKKKRPRSKAVSKIENPTADMVPLSAPLATTRGRRSKRAAPTKHRQLKSIKSPVVKKAKKASA